MTPDIERLQERLRAFSAERDWDQYHTPKNLAMALAGEAGELLAEFQWLTPEEAQSVMEDAGKAAAVRDELADVAIYLLRLADVLGVDLAAAADAKIDRNGRDGSPPTAWIDPPIVVSEVTPIAGEDAREKRMAAEPSPRRPRDAARARRVWASHWP